MIEHQCTTAPATYDRLFVDIDFVYSVVKTYSNAVSERRSLVDFSLRPILKAIEERLSLPDFVPNPVMVRFALDDFLRGNALERAQVYEILNRIGAMSVEQIQREEDLIPNEG